MKHFFTKATLFAMVALFFAACKETPEEVVTPVDPVDPVDKFALTVEVKAVTHNSIEATVTPANEEGAFYAAIHTAAEVGEDNGAALAQSLIENGIVSKLQKGTQNISASELTPESEYYVVAFGYDFKTSSMTTEIVLSDKITTLETPTPDMLGTIALSLQEDATTWRKALIDVTISDESLEFVCDILPKAEWDAKYAENKELIVEDRVAGWQKSLEEESKYYPELDTWQKWMELWQYSGNQTIDASVIRNLYWDSEYVIYCFGMNDNGEQTTSVEALEFKTSTPIPSSNQIEITIDYVNKKYVEFTVTTTNDDDYLVFIERADNVDLYGEGKDRTIEELIFGYSLLKNDEELAAITFSGSRKFTNEDLNKTLTNNREYKVVIWGFNNGPTTEVFFSEPFTPTTRELTIVNGAVDGSSLSATVTPKPEDLTYYAAFHSIEEIGADEGVALAEQLIAGEGFASSLLTGEQTISATDLASGNYKVVAFGYDTTNNKMLTRVTLGDVVTVEKATPFTIAVSDNSWCDATVVFTPADATMKYIIGGMTKEEFDASYASELTKLYDKDKDGWVQEEAWYGTSWVENMSYYLREGELTTTATEVVGQQRLRWSTEYVIYCYGVNAEGELSSDIITSQLSTTTPVASDATFTITIDNVAKKHVEFTITPSTDEPYYVTIQKESYLQSYGTEDGKMSYDEMIFELLKSTTDFQMESRVYNGSQTLTHEDVGASLSTFYNYYIVVWGFNNGPTTEVVISEAFKPVDPS